jgi:hypothetical protein
LTITSFSGVYRFLSNFWYSPVIDGNIIWPTVEHGYQWAKADFSDVPPQKVEETLLKYLALTPGQAKEWGQNVKLVENWDEIKISVMRRLIKAKFKNPELRAKLLATGDQELIEGNWWGDVFWGICKGKGQNHLGKILMAERNEIRLFMEEENDS